MTPDIEPVTRSKHAARRMYDRISRWYDLLSGSSEAPYKTRALEMLAAQPGESVLELGVGTGDCINNLARTVGDHGQALGLDLSMGMLRQSRHRALRAGLKPFPPLIQADAAALPYAAASFDALFCSFTLELFDSPELPRVLAECQRVLRPGGRLAIAAMDQAQQKGPASRIYLWFHRHLPTLVDCRPIPVTRLLEAAGFQLEEEEHAWMWGLPVAMVLARKSRGT